MLLGVIALVVIIILAAKPWSPRQQAVFRPCGVAPNQINRFTTRKGPNKAVELVYYLPWKWRQSTLRVFFKDVDDEALQKKVLEVANTWQQYTGVKFVRTASIFDSEIRLSFRTAEGYQSLIGSLADSTRKQTSSLAATMHLQDLDQRSDEEFRRVILHEFGHALGLLHELSSINTPIVWDSPAVYKYFDTAYHWNQALVNEQVLTPARYAKATSFDPHSIMIYAVPSFLMKNHPDIPWPKGLSKDDKAKIKLVYR